MIVIVTTSDDLHALQIRRVILERGYRDCYIFECDRIATSCRLHARVGRTSASQLFLTDGTAIDVGAIDVIWWRRVRANQDLGETEFDNDAKTLINNDCRGGLAGILATSFNGRWVSDPDATDRAADKIFQLQVAKQCGFRIPETLVSQSASEVAEFVDTLGDCRIIVKPIVGVAGPLLFTQFLDDHLSIDSASYRVVPAMYQEYIPGTTHIRLNCFGDRSYAATIESDALDWRPNLNVPVRSWEVPHFLHTRVRRVLDELGLAMGIVDLKMTPEGEPVWLEVNPQGQFLFLEGLTQLPLSAYFADYLISTSELAGSERVRTARLPN